MAVFAAARPDRPPRGRRRRHVAKPCGSRQLAQRSCSIDAETYVIEIKAAAIDVVAEARRSAASGSCSRGTTSCRFPASPASTELLALADAAVAEKVPA